jgi:hypothetical protein
MAAFCLGALGSAAAQAETVTVGAASLTPGMDNLDSLGAVEAPVFQGDAGPGYVLSSPQSGAVTSFSFLSAGAAPGARFALTVLRPAEGEGNWKLEEVSAPVAVSTATGEDALNGPYPVNLPIEAGDRIGLEPIGSDETPIELTMDPADGVRYFSSPFPGPGSTEGIAPGSSIDNGQILPLQATVSSTPASGSPTPAPTPATSPPVDLTPPMVKGTPQAGQTLTCETGTWTNSPTYSITWSQTTSQLVPGAKPPKVTSTTVEVASGPTYLVPDLPEGVSISCTVTASNAATVPGAGPKASSVAVGVETIPPALAPSFSFVDHTKHNTPTISEGVGYGGTNICRPGVWLHYPTAFSYLWFENVYNPRLHRNTPKLIHGGQKLTISIQLERHEIYCRVTASNSAGHTSANSNTVVVPRLAPKALGPIRIEVAEPPPITQNPSTSREEPLYWRSAGAKRAAFALTCHAPKFNRHVSTAYSWEAQFYATSKSGSGLPASGPFDPEDTLSSQTLEITPNPHPAHSLPAGDEPLLNGQPPAFTGTVGSWNGELAVQCSVNAHIYGTKLHTIVTSSTVYLLADLPVSGGIGGVAVETKAG